MTSKQIFPSSTTGYLDYRIEAFPRADCYVVAVAWKHFENGQYLIDPGLSSPWWTEIRGFPLSEFLFGSIDDRVAKEIPRTQAKAEHKMTEVAYYRNSRGG